MRTHDNDVVNLTYTDEDHHTWHQLYTRQIERVAGIACRAFLDGLPRLSLDPQRLPDRDAVEARIHQLSGWTLGDAQNEYLGATEWFEHLAACRFPVTDYIRKPHELDFTPLPDLFHEYFGHLAYFTDPAFGEMARRYGEVYGRARDEQQQLAIARLWWYTTEFGLIREGSELKVLGAGLLSSPGEFAHALSDAAPRSPFDIARVAATPGAAYSYHDEYFILESMAHLYQVIEDYAAQEGLG
jgi:phenylalanine-4-hydroxylase